MPEQPTPPQNSESEGFPREGESHADYTYRMKMLSVDQKRAAEKRGARERGAREGENPEQFLSRAIERAKKIQHDRLVDFINKLRKVSENPEAILKWDFYGVINFLFGRHCTEEHVCRGYHGTLTD